MHCKGDHKQYEKTAHRMGENICKWFDWQGIILQNLQVVYAPQYHQNTQPNQKKGRRPK